MIFSQNWLKNDWRIIYIRLYTMIYRQNLTQKMRNIVYTLYYDFEWKIESKIGKKNDSGIVYNSIYYHLQSKIDWKMSRKNEAKQYIRLYSMILSQFLIQ